MAHEQPSFDPDSLDAVLAKILTNQENQKDMLKEHIETTHVYHTELRSKIDAMNGRVTTLEGDKKKQQGIAIGAGFGGGGLVAGLLKYFGGGQ